ncbi:MAG: succinyl-diaminopimelate desuccinylase [Actinomycetota bacterium]|nr:succinyl-diaminopimelate desuccinylase [Actinomycetota bacterium]
MPALDLTADVVDLAAAVCDVPSVSGQETALADVLEAALRALPHLEVLRDGDAVLARTRLGRTNRVIIAGHIDTVPIADNVPSWRTGSGEDEVLWGRGTVDMKAGVAVMASLAAELVAPRHDVTWVFYDNEEVDAARNGLGRIARNLPEWLAGDFAILGEPSNGSVEGGCNGTLRVEVRTHGEAAHSARAWMGSNAIHAAAPILSRLAAYAPATVEVDGLAYRESLNAVRISGGVANNVIPDACTVTVNYRFAPSTSVAQAEAHVREVLAGFEVEVTDAAGGARPGLDHPAAAEFVSAVLRRTGREPAPKYGWTDVARFAELGIPAVNFGPGDPSLAHHDAERCPTVQIRECRIALRSWLAP